MVFSQCTSYTVDGHTIDLEALNGLTLNISQYPYDYFYTPCENNLPFSDSNGTQYVIAERNKYEVNQLYLAQWVDVETTFIDGIFSFEWDNGKISPSCHGEIIFQVNYNISKCNIDDLHSNMSL